MIIFDYFKIEVVPGSFKRLELTDEVYFGPEYKDYVSNSKLALLNPAQGGSPHKFFRGKFESKSTSLALGSAVHQLTLEKDSYVLSSTTRPSSKLGKVCDNYIENIKQGMSEEKAITLAALQADYYTTTIEKAKNKEGLPSVLVTALNKIKIFLSNSQDKLTSDGKQIIYLPADLHDRCVNCVESLKNHEKIQEYLYRDEFHMEDVIICELKITFPKSFRDPFGEQVTQFVKLKMKADNWTIDHEKKIVILNDLKTTGKDVSKFMGYMTTEPKGIFGEMEEVWNNGSFDIFHYFRQMPMYGFMLKGWVEQEYNAKYKLGANMLVVETIAPFNSALYTVSNAQMSKGWEEFKQLIKRVAYHQEKGMDSLIELEVC